MGSGLSANYDNLTYLFTIGAWKIYSGIHRSSGQSASLWQLDQELLNKIIPNQADQQVFINGYSTGIKKIRVLRHPRILRIIEVQDYPTDFQFSTEPVSACLKSLVGKIDSNDASYFAFQIIEALNFLHNDAKMVHFGLSTSAIFVNDQLCVKLFNFNWISPIGEDGNLPCPFENFATSCAFPNIKYCAPEIILSQECNGQTDIFSFAAIFTELLTGKQLLGYTKVNEYDTGKNPISSVQGMNPKFYTLLSNCLQPNNAQRPKASTIINNELFQTVQMKIFRYMDMIIAKDSKDKFSFFKGLTKIISGFSHLALKKKIIPLMIDECKADARFAPILLVLIFTAAKDFEVDEFTNLVFKKVIFMAKIVDPPQVQLAFLQHLDTIIVKTDISLHEENVYPLVANALKSPNSLIHKECLKKLPASLDKMSGVMIKKIIYPRLIQLAIDSSDVNIISTSLSSVAASLKKVENDQFIIDNLAQVYKVWNNHKCPAVACSLAEIFNNLNGSIPMTMERAVPFACDVASSGSCDPYYQNQLCNWIINFVNKYKEHYQLDQVVDPVVDQAQIQQPMIMANPSQPIDMGNAFLEYFDMIDKSPKPSVNPDLLLLQ